MKYERYTDLLRTTVCVVCGGTGCDADDIGNEFQCFFCLGTGFQFATITDIELIDLLKFYDITKREITRDGIWDVILTKIINIEEDYNEAQN